MIYIGRYHYWNDLVSALLKDEITPDEFLKQVYNEETGLFRHGWKDDDDYKLPADRLFKIIAFMHSCKGEKIIVTHDGREEYMDIIYHCDESGNPVGNRGDWKEW